MKSLIIVILAVLIQIPAEAQERTRTDDIWRGFRLGDPLELGASKAWIKDDYICSGLSKRLTLCF